MVILDATVLLLLLNENTPPPRDSTTNEPIADAHERVSALANSLEASGEKILIASPVLAELLVRAEQASAGYLQEFNTSSRFRLAAFDQKAAVEHSIYTRKALESGDKFGGVTDAWQKIKFDRQIVAIAISEGAHTIYSDDKNLRVHAEKLGLKVVSIGELSLNAQGDLFSAEEMEQDSEKTKGGQIV